MSSHLLKTEKSRVRDRFEESGGLYKKLGERSGKHVGPGELHLLNFSAWTMPVFK